MRKVLFQIKCISGDPGNDAEPGNEGEVGITVLVADQILTVCKNIVHRFRHTTDFVDVAHPGAFDLLRVVFGEPYCLAEVGALTRHLEVEPLLGVEVFRSAGFETELLLFVVGFNQVFKDSTRLPQGDSCVGILDGGNTAVGVELEEGLTLDFGELKIFVFVRNIKFVEEHGHLPGVGTGGMPMEDNRLKRHLHWIL